MDLHRTQSRRGLSNLFGLKNLERAVGTHNISLFLDRGSKLSSKTQTLAEIDANAAVMSMFRFIRAAENLLKIEQNMAFFGPNFQMSEAKTE